MKVPCEQTNIYKMYLSVMLYGIQIHRLSKLRITNIEVDILNKEKIPDKKFLEQYKCLLCYKVPDDTSVYFYYNFPDYYKLYPKKTPNKPSDLECPYEIKINFKDENENDKKLIVRITGFSSSGLNTSIINEDGLTFVRYEEPIDCIMTLEEKEIILNLKDNII